MNAAQNAAGVRRQRPAGCDVTAVNEWTNICISDLFELNESAVRQYEIFRGAHGLMQGS